MTCNVDLKHNFLLYRVITNGCYLPFGCYIYLLVSTVAKSDKEISLYAVCLFSTQFYFIYTIKASGLRLIVYNCFSSSRCFPLISRSGQWNRYLVFEIETYCVWLRCVSQNKPMASNWISGWLIRQSPGHNYYILNCRDKRSRMS